MVKSKIENLKKGFGELTLEDKMSFLTDVGVNYNPDSCFKCKDIIRTNYNFKIYLRYANRAFEKYNICPNCISEFFKIEYYKIEFFGFIENFKKSNTLSNYGVWDKKTVVNFISEIEKNKIKVDNNRIICDDSRYSYAKGLNLLDLIKKYKLKMGKVELYE